MNRRVGQVHLGRLRHACELHVCTKLKEETLNDTTEMTEADKPAIFWYFHTFCSWYLTVVALD